MIVKTRIFELSHSNYKNLVELAQAMGMSVSQIYRVRQGKRNINQKFIVGAMKAFSGHTFDELFYFAPGVPIVTDNHSHEGLTEYSIGEQAEGKQRKKSKRQAVGIT